MASNQGICHYHPDNIRIRLTSVLIIRIAFNQGAHPLNMYMAEELSHLYLAIQLSEDRQREMRTRLEIATEEIVRSRNETRRAHRELNNRDRTITRLMASNMRFRSTFAQGLRQRAFPPSVVPTLRRIATDQNQEVHREIARQDIVNHFRALRERVIADNPISDTDGETTEDEGE